jgi:choline dehydrogenase
MRPPAPDAAGTYDYVIVGGGSAGCVLAYRLSEDARFSVLLIEAGSDRRSRVMSMPMGFMDLLSDRRVMWHLPSERDPADADTGGDARLWLAGKALGGSSAVNAMLYCRGQAEDYDGWNERGATGWGWKEIEPCFRGMETGAGGGAPLLPVSLQPHRSAFTEALLAGAGALGVPRRHEVHRGAEEGIGYSPMTADQGRRVSAADAFLKPAGRRPNLKVITETLATRIVFEGRRAIGVECARGGARCVFRARRDVICVPGAARRDRIRWRFALAQAAAALRYRTGRPPS